MHKKTDVFMTFIGKIVEENEQLNEKMNLFRAMHYPNQYGNCERCSIFDIQVIYPCEIIRIVEADDILKGSR